MNTQFRAANFRAGCRLGGLILAVAAVFGLPLSFNVGRAQVGLVPIWFWSLRASAGDISVSNAMIPERLNVYRIHLWQCGPLVVQTTRQTAKTW